jgi:hypothetical protein
LVLSSRLGNQVVVLVTVVLLLSLALPVVPAVEVPILLPQPVLLLLFPLVSTRLLVILLVRRTLAMARAFSLLLVLVLAMPIVRLPAVPDSTAVPFALALELRLRTARLVAALAVVLLLLLLQPALRLLSPVLLVPRLLKEAQAALLLSPLVSTLLLATPPVSRTLAMARAFSSLPVLASAMPIVRLPAVLDSTAVPSALALEPRLRTERRAAVFRPLPSEALSLHELLDDSALKRMTKTGDQTVAGVKREDDFDSLSRLLIRWSLST